MAGAEAAGPILRATSEERDSSFGCDRYPGYAFFRGVTVQAEPQHLFRWLCQLKVAPYSYDWLDNLGRQSPRQLTPGADRLELGQRFMFLFRLVGFDSHQLTLKASRVAVSYRIFPPHRLVVKIKIDLPRPLSWLLAAGDYLMMRKQLLTLKYLAER